jgi:hypothetical protein
VIKILLKRSGRVIQIFGHFPSLLSCPNSYPLQIFRSAEVPCKLPPET